ncbi:MAG: hypothetical protein KKC80_04725 [Candidatus Margulisbacteria bacterium]|nr:hypothetical protein [Candidatus Margulisiibacteriota bacterium]MBU1616760.1 hypothetical protein [Candidatus Margulisiibacteriota bacterium]
MGISSFLVIWSLLMALVLLAIGFITWVLAVKESGWLKIAGQIIAVVIVVLTLLLLVLGSSYRDKMNNRMGKGMMMDTKGGTMMNGDAPCMDKGKIAAPMKMKK